MAKKSPPPASIQALTAEATLMSRLQGLPEEELKDILETMWGNAKIEYATMPDGNTGVRVYSGTSTQHDPADLKGARLFSPSESAANAHAGKYGGKTRITSEVIPMMSAVSGAKVQSGIGEKFGYGYEIELNKQGQVVTPTKRSTKEIGLLSGTTPTIAQKFAPPPASSTQTMQEFMASKGIDRMQSGTRDAYYHSDGTVRNNAGDILDEGMPKTVPSDAAPAEMSAKSKAMRSGLTDLETGKTSRFYKPGLGMLGVGLGAALAPEEAWAAPFSEEGLNYWGGTATGLDLAKAASDPSRLSPFSIGATLAEDTASGLGQMIGSGLDTSQVGADIQPDYGMGGGYVGFGPEYRAGPDLPQSYDLSGQTPSLAGTQTGMPVAMDAGGAVPAQVGDWTQGGVHHAGGYELGPAVDSRFMNNEGVLTGGVPAVDYSQMAQDWGDPTMMSAPAFEQPDLSQPVSTGNLAYTGMPSVFTGPGAQVAQLGGIPSGNSLAVSPQTDQDYLDLGVTPLGSEVAHPAQSPLLDQRYLEQLDKQTVTDPTLGHLGYTDPLSAIEDANVSASNVTQTPMSKFESTVGPFLPADVLSGIKSGWGVTSPNTDVGYYGDPKGVIEDALAGILGGTINPAEVAVGGPQLSGAFPQYAGNPYGTMATEESDYGPFATPNFAGQQAPYGGPMMDTSLMSGFGKVGENVEEFVHYKDLVDKLVASGAVKAPTGYVSSVDVTDDLSLPGIQHAMSSDTYGYQSGLKAALANEILGMGPKTWGTAQDIQELGRKFTGGGATPAMMDAQKQEGTKAINAALADPSITAQDTINDYNAQIQAAFQSALTNPSDVFTGTGTQVASLGSVPAQVSAPAQQNVINAQMVQEATNRQRQEQASVDAQMAAAVMAPRQDAMPQAPAGPSPAQIAAQVAAAEQAHRDQQASAQRALRAFYNSRDYQEGGASAPAGLIEIATEVDTFGSGNPFSEQYQGGYVDMGGFESRDGGMGGGGGRDHGGGHHGR